MAPPSQAENPFELPSPSGDPLRRSLFSLVKDPLETLLGLREYQRLYRLAHRDREPRDFIDTALACFDIRYELPPEHLERIPREGPLIVVANHPFGGLEGLILASLLRSVRPDTKLLANFLLGRIPELREHLILVDPFGKARSVRFNAAPIKESITWLRKGGVLGIFPAGQVSYLHLRRGVVCDRQWQTPVAHLIRKTQVPVLPVFFEGRNGLAFQLAGLIHPLLRTAMLPRAILKKRGQTVRVQVGRVVPFSKLDSFIHDTDLLSYLRVRTYMLSGDDPHQEIRRLTSIRRHRQSQLPVVEPVDPTALTVEVASLPEEQLLISSGEYEVWCSEAHRIPNVLREIGRLREVTFRQVGEGCGEPIDIDPFDHYYLHLFLWNKNTSEVVGAYRLGQTDEILPKYGQKGLNTSRFYKLADKLLVRIDPALELGRSFVRAEYQKQHSPMALLWKGIGAFIARNPRYRTLFGMVSISNDYLSVSRQMMIAFLQAHAFLPTLAKLARAKKPPRLQAKDEVEYCGSPLADIDEVSSLISGIENDQKGVPVLLRQYLRLNAKFLSCHVVPFFGEIWSGLMMADLTQAHPRILERHLGKAGAARFLEYHRQQGRLVG